MSTEQEKNNPKRERPGENRSRQKFYWRGWSSCHDFGVNVNECAEKCLLTGLWGSFRINCLLSSVRVLWTLSVTNPSRLMTCKTQRRSYTSLSPLLSLSFSSTLLSLPHAATHTHSHSHIQPTHLDEKAKYLLILPLCTRLSFDCTRKWQCTGWAAGCHGNHLATTAAAEHLDSGS